MATIGQITDGLETAISTTGLRAPATDRDIAAPAVVIEPTSGRPRTLGTVKETQEFVVHVIVSDASNRVARDALDGYLSPTGDTSIRAAVQADNRLGGLAGVVAVYMGWENYGSVVYAGNEYFGADVLITVEN